MRAQGNRLLLNREAAISWDVAGFRQALAAAAQAERQGREAAIPHFQEAIALYQGPLLPTAVEEEWLVAPRARIAEQFLCAGKRLGDLLLAAGQPETALSLAELLVAEDAADEGAWAQPMRADLAAGDRAAALRGFARATQTLQSLLDLAPGPELTALARQARQPQTGR